MSTPRFELSPTTRFADRASDYAVSTAFNEVRLIAPVTVEFARSSMPEAYRLIRVMYRHSNPD